MSRRIACLVIFIAFLSGCSGNRGLLDFLQVSDFESTRVEMNHPGGPIEEPHIPPDLQQEADARPDPAEATQTSNIRYKMEIVINGEVEKGLDKSISRAFRRASLLQRLRRSPPENPAGLEQRMRADLRIGKDVLEAFGYYAGNVRGEVHLVEQGNPESRRSRDRYEVVITFTPGVRYRIGTSHVTASEPSARAAQAADPLDRGRLPSKLADVNLVPGIAAVADEVLDAVNEVRHVFRSRGYPHAEIDSARYFLNHEERTLEAEVDVESGEQVYMGSLELTGSRPVPDYYFEAHKNWRVGRLWNQDRIDRFRENLRQTGLFASIDINPSEELNEHGERNVVVGVTGALERTVGGALRYDSDLGLGVLGYWENRNLTGRGDKLRIELPIWQELQELAASYRLPFFMRDNQDLLLNGGVLHEDNDSYKLFTGSAAIGVERRFSRYWSGTARVRVEGGEIEEREKEKQDYYMLGLPLSLTFNDTRNPLDAVRGVRVTASGAPYWGEYDGEFTALRARVDANAYLPLVGRDRLVLALRGVYGSLFMAESQDVPPTIRFYSGGGGSVRGYDFRSIGPRNDRKDPLGGDSLVEGSVELRWRFAESWGLVAFTDAGMVYTSDLPSLDEQLRWGLGLGVRYYTVLGPVRFDVATPLNPRDDDSSIQLYISIGQSF